MNERRRIAALGSATLSEEAADQTASEEQLREWVAEIARQNWTSGRPPVRVFTARA